MKKHLFVLCLMGSVFLHISTAKAADTSNVSAIEIQINNEILSVEQSPYIEKGRAFVPIRNVAEALDSKVAWNPATQTVTIEKDHRVVQMEIASNSAKVNDQALPLDAAPSLTNGKTFVPVRFVAEALKYKVNWDEKNQMVKIENPIEQKIEEKPIEQPAEPKIPEQTKAEKYTPEDLYWLSRIVEAEARGESYEGKLAVANVILNRVRSNQFPNTIKEVIFDRAYGEYQFSPVSNGSINNSPSEQSKAAALSALQGNNNIGEALFFLNPSIATSTWIQKNRIFIKTIGQHSFYF